MEQRRESQSNLGDRAVRAVKFVKGRQSTAPKDLAQHLGIDNKVASNLLASLVKSGHIDKDNRGTYVALGSERNESGENDSPLSFHSPPPNTCGCGVELRPDNDTGLCAECLYIARNEVIGSRLNGRQP
jgi:hypothetical protein